MFAYYFECIWWTEIRHYCWGQCEDCARISIKLESILQSCKTRIKQRHCQWMETEVYLVCGYDLANENLWNLQLSKFFILGWVCSTSNYHLSAECKECLSKPASAILGPSSCLSSEELRGFQKTDKAPSLLYSRTVSPQLSAPLEGGARSG